MTNFVYFHHLFCHSERSEESPDLSELDRTLSLVGEGRVRYEQPLSPNVINNPVIASTSGRGNLIKSTSNDPEPMRLLRRFAPHNDKSKKCAFTLAEIMITIGIVGVVAAITIPRFIQNSNSKKFCSFYELKIILCVTIVEQRIYTI